MDAIFQLTGTLIVFAVLLDVFLVVLFPSSGHGLLQGLIARFTSMVFRWASHPLPDETRRNLLSYNGPVIIMLTLATWLALLVVGWGMIYYPVLGEAIRASTGITQTTWATALYFSAFNLTTLGVGNIVADNGVYRLLSVIQAGVGFSFFSMVITYFLAIYPNLVSRNTFAQQVYYLCGRGRGAATLIARFAQHETSHEVASTLGKRIEPLCQIYEAHRFYPILRHFHYQQQHYTMSFTLFALLDAVTLIRSALNRNAYRELAESPEVEDMYQASMTLIDELTKGDYLDSKADPDRTTWTKDFLRSWEILYNAGIDLESDREMALKQYLAVRECWAPAVSRLESAKR